MANRWTPKEIAELKRLVNLGIKDTTIALRLGRTESGVINERIRVIGSFIFCVDCGVKVEKRKGKRVRCISCSAIRTAQRKKDRAAELYAERKEYQKGLRDRLRFNGNRELIIKRDNARCVDCGLTRENHLLVYGCDICVDHIDGVGRNSPNQNNDPSNLATRCISCKGKRDVGKRRKDWSMCALRLKKYWLKQKENESKSVTELLLEGKTPGKTSGKLHWT